MAACHARSMLKPDHEGQAQHCQHAGRGHRGRAWDSRLHTLRHRWRRHAAHNAPVVLSLRLTDMSLLLKDLLGSMQGRNGTCGEAQSGDRHPSCRPRPRGRLGEGALHVPHSLLTALMQLAGLDNNLWQRVPSPVSTGYAVCGVGPVGMHREMFATRTAVSPSVSQV